MNVMKLLIWYITGEAGHPEHKPLKRCNTNNDISIISIYYPYVISISIYFDDISIQQS